MLIYTQYGDILKFKDIIKIYINDHDVIRCDIGASTNITLGSYKTRERCKEITKEITVKYNETKKFELKAKSGKYDYYSNDSNVYYMPEE